VVQKKLKSGQAPKDEARMGTLRSRALPGTVKYADSSDDDESDEDEGRKTKKAKGGPKKKAPPPKDESYNPRGDYLRSKGWKNPLNRAIATSSLGQGTRFWVLFRSDIPDRVASVRNMTVEKILTKAVDGSKKITAAQVPPPPNFTDVFPETITIGGSQVQRWGTSPLGYFAVYLSADHYGQIIPADKRSRPYNYNTIFNAYIKHFNENVKKTKQQQAKPAPCVLDPAVVGTLTASRYASLINVTGRGTGQGTLMGVEGINAMAMDMWELPTANRPKPKDFLEAEVSGISLSAMRLAPRHDTPLMLPTGFSGLTESLMRWARSTTPSSILMRTTFKPLNKEEIWCSRPSRLTQCLCGEHQRPIHETLLTDVVLLLVGSRESPSGSPP
jgi:hypothetical protein